MKHLCKDDNEHILSTHDALMFEIILPHSATSPSQNEEVLKSSQLKLNHLKWEEANLELYWNLEKFLQQNFNTWENPENIQILSITIPHAFIQAANLAVPLKKNTMPSFKVKKSEEWRKAEIAAQKATKKWRADGCPREQENELFLDKKQA